MRIGIIGAGISGLSTALELAKRGHDVSVFQREGEIGGLIATFDFEGVRLEHFYHFLCRGDEGYFALCRELGLEDRIRFQRALTGFYHEGTCYPFSTPIDLLRFTAIPFSQRVRFGLFALEARLRTEWAQLDEMRAVPWLIDRLGKQAYEVIWDPLLTLKFGDQYKEISAAWVWHRLHRVARSGGRMGYLEGGTSLLIDTLVKRIKDLGVQIYPGAPVTQIRCTAGRVTGLGFEHREDLPCDRVVSTVPLPVVGNLLPDEYRDYADALRRIQYIGVVCQVFKLKRRVSRYFWLNVHDKRVPTNGIIEYTNLNPLDGTADHIVYVPYYVATNHRYYGMDDESLFTMSWNTLKVINPELQDSDMIAHHVSRAAFAQAVCTSGFLSILPAQRSPIEGLWLLDSTFLYPEDRTQSGHILKAKECAEALEVPLSNAAS